MRFFFRMPKVNFISIDPGITCCGFSFFVDGLLHKSGFIRGKGATWLDRVDYVIDRIEELTTSIPSAQTVAIELPQAMGTAASNGNSIIKLMGFIMAVRERLKGNGLIIVTIPVRSWKGSVPKHITELRVRRRHPEWCGTDSNECDAIGIGDYYLSILCAKPKDLRRREGEARR